MKKYDVGIDLGGTKVLCAIVEKNINNNLPQRKVIFEVKKKTKKEKGNKKITSKLFEAIDELFEISNIKQEEIDSIGIAIAGQIERKSGTVVNACNLEIKNLEIKKILEQKYSIKTNVFNDVEAAAIGELILGAGKNHNDILCVFIGTGIGSSIIINKKIYRGISGSAGEIGHIIVDLNGRSCSCGAVGCLEAYASRSAIESRIQGAIKKGRKSIITELTESQHISTKHIKQALDAHDEITTQYVNEAIEYLSGGLASAINFFNPELIILGGGLIQGIDEIYLKTVRLAKAKALRIASEKTEFKKAELKDYSAVIGATLTEEYNNAF